MSTSELFGGQRAERFAWAGWVALFLVMAAIIAHDSTRSVLAVYRFGSTQWIAGRTLYEFTGIGGFTYLPHAAILFIPFALLPPLAGEVLWRLLNIAVFAVGLSGFARLAGERSGKDLFPLMTLVTLPLAWGCARNGQATLLMTGFMLLAAADLARSRWWRSTLWLALAVAVKPLAIVLVLIIGARERHMTLRLAAGMALLALFPFATQHPAYVAGQYAASIQNMALSAHVGVVAHGWTTPFTALRVAGIDVPERVQTVMRLAAAVATLALYGMARRRQGAAAAAVHAYSLAAVYLILFSPRTENNTYVMLGPVIGVFLTQAVRAEQRTGEAVMLGGILAVLLGSRQLEHLLTPHASDGWLSPLMASFVAVYLVAKLFATDERRRGGAGIPSA